jgi:hypothetical protein
MANWPNEPPALTRPLARPRFSGGSARPTEAAAAISEICVRLMVGARSASRRRFIVGAISASLFSFCSVRES